MICASPATSTVAGCSKLAHHTYALLSQGALKNILCRLILFSLPATLFPSLYRKYLLSHYTMFQKLQVNIFGITHFFRCVGPQVIRWMGVLHTWPEGLQKLIGKNILKLLEVKISPLIFGFLKNVDNLFRSSIFSSIDCIGNNASAVSLS